MPSSTLTRPSGTHSFADAMNRVYGNFDCLSDKDAAKWNPPHDPERCLWTDAFGVVNFVTLYRDTGNSKYITLAERLVAAVHNVLGRTRDGKARLPGATDQEPLNGGLRMGKLEGSECDGQQHTYLTMWMFALNRLSLASKDPLFNDLAVQLAKVIHPRFVSQTDVGKLKLAWKVSVDMKEVLVPSEGHLDAATGFAIYRILQGTAQRMGGDSSDRMIIDGHLDQEISDYSQIMSRRLVTMSKTPSGDLLDLGITLWICHFFDHETWADELRHSAVKLASTLLSQDSAEMRSPASQRCARKEFAAVLGARCASPDKVLKGDVSEIVDFWGDRIDANDDGDMQPISQVMYAAALSPGAFKKGYLSD